MQVTLKSGWADATLAEYAAFVRDVQPLLSSASDVEQIDGLLAFARWVSDAPAEWLEADVKRLLAIFQDCPWCSTAPAEGTDPVPLFTYNGTEYHYVGDLDTISAGQLQALLGMIEQHPDPGNQWPHLLAVLYKEAGAKQSVDTYNATAAALSSLPISTAWPALAFFLRRSAPLVHAFRASFDARTRAQQLETAAETALSALQTVLDTRPTRSGLRGFFLTWQRSAALRYLRSVKKTLAKY